MNFAESLVESCTAKLLLKHPFYKAWDHGALSAEDLQRYARQYYQHVKSFPRYISATHSRCEDIESRQVLLENLMDEEYGDDNHPELWLRFGEGVGTSREDSESEEALPETQNLIDTFMRLADSSYAEGLGALYIYEQQVPAICETKIRGLKQFYGLSDERGLRYFTLHHTVDVAHSDATAELLEKLSPEEKELAAKGAREGAEALWGFLDGMERVSSYRQNGAAHTC